MNSVQGLSQQFPHSQNQREAGNGEENKAFKNVQKKGGNSERKEAERTNPALQTDLKAELSAVGCHDDPGARTAPVHWLRCRNQWEGAVLAGS